jgi:TatD DNase family protein
MMLPPIAPQIANFAGMTLIDTHAHLYDEALLPRIEEVMQNAANEGVNKIYLPAIDSNCTAAMLSLEQQFPGKCIAMMGLHPCYVKENYQQELAHVANWLAKRSFAAVGEIGLDHYWDKTHAAEQEKAFIYQMELALQYHLPIVIHTRNAMQETVNLVKPFAKRGLTGIFHCFSGSTESATQIINMGFLLGIGGVVTYPKAGLAEVVAHIDLAHLVLETDAPYLTPVPFRGKRNESSYLKYIVEKIAAVKNTSIIEVAAVTTANAQKIFGA